MTITVTPTVDLTSTPARVSLAVSASAGETAATVTRINPDGSTVPVRTSDGNPLPLSGGAGSLSDYEAPYGLAVSYSSVESSTTISAQVTVNVTVPWLIHVGVPGLSMPINLRPGTLQDDIRTMTRGVFPIMGRTTPIVVTDSSRKAAASQIVVTTQSLGELGSIKALLADGSPLLLNIPDSMGAGFSAKYISVGDVKISRFTDVSIDGNRDVTMPFVEVDRPAGGSQATRTWADIIAAYSSWQQVEAAYSSWTALISGP